MSPDTTGGLSASERLLLADSWPLELVESRGPVVTKDASEFFVRVLLGNHLEDVVVFRGGSSEMGLTAYDCLPTWFRTDCDSAVDFLQRLGDNGSELKANVEYSDIRGIQRELRGKSKSEQEIESDSDDGDIGLAMERLLEKKEVLDSAYVCELRSRKNSRRRKADACFWPSDEHTAVLGSFRSKTILKRQMADAFGELAQFTLCWDTQDDGLFVGGRNTGKGLHVDQVFWSNIGNNMIGHKLLAVWDKGQISSDLHTDMLDYVFSFPLNTQRLTALQKAKTIALLRPGDLFLISGGTAHATLSLDFNVTAYESLVTLNATNITHFLRTGRKFGRYGLRRGAMPRSELEDYKDHVLDSLHSIAMRHFHFPTTAYSLTSSSIPLPLVRATTAILKDAYLNAIRHLSERDTYFHKSLPASVRALISDDESSDYSSSHSEEPSLERKDVLTAVGRTRQRRIRSGRRKQKPSSTSSSSLSSRDFPRPRRSDRFVSRSPDYYAHPPRYHRQLDDDDDVHAAGMKRQRSRKLKKVHDAPFPSLSSERRLRAYP